MVLEEAEGPSSGGFASDEPSNDQDFYSNNTLSASSHRIDPSTPYRVDASRLPKIWTILGKRQIGSTETQVLAKRLNDASDLIKRRLRPDEVDALSFHYAKSLAVTSNAIPVGLAAGAFRAYQTRENFRFPFFKPIEKSWFDPNKFGPLTGARARIAWHSVRFNAFGIAGIIAGFFFFSTYSMSVSLAGMSTDPRLKDFNQSLSDRQKAARGELQSPQPRGQGSPMSTSEGRMDNQAERARDMLNRRRQQQQAQTGNTGDDMSPTSADWGSDQSQSSSDSGFYSDQEMQRRERMQSRSPGFGSESRPQSDYSDYQSNSQSSSFDDASPQAGAQSQPKQYPTGSTWERLRKEAAAGQQPPSQERRQGRTAGWGPVQREQQQGATVGDSFSFSGRDEDKELAKMEAQKDFDARVERERHGGDFQEQGKGWRR